MRPIGLSGIAKSGKDTFCSLLVAEFKQLGIKAQRFALADELKLKVRNPLYELSNIDILKCSPEEKELVRDYLVAVGKIKRKQSKGKYWTSLLQQQILSEPSVIPIITDIRYHFYPEDEVFWLKKVMGGKLIHLHRTINGIPLTPPNKDEEENDPKVRANADKCIYWPTITNISDATNDVILKEIVKETVNWYIND